ncbi:uncharacterized protein LOC113144799 [Mastacembelus armatus]|uniref:uncharacterized protein LOC113144799 n=1 Tax=Mastacembelus armatus TaxID=205130 RepID=UPI000E460D36|nr:uncharacterized protein LOC113144799 [Mastacembelus armatus]
MADRIGMGQAHRCEEKVLKEEQVRPDLQATPLQDARDLYTDGCCFRDEKEGLRAAYAVVEDTGGELQVRVAERLEGQHSAQRAELMAVVAALKLVSSLTDTISLSSSDGDLRKQATGRSGSSKDDMGSSAVKVPLPEAAKEMVENALHRKPGGENILEEYREENSLGHRTQRQLINILASDMTERHGKEITNRIPSCQQRETYALGIITLLPSLKDPFSPKDYVNQDFLLLFGAETASKLLEKWDTSFKPKVIKEAKHLTQSTDLCSLPKAAEKLTENDENGMLQSMLAKRRTKISPSEAVDKMVHFHKSCCSIDEHLQERVGKQPYILAVDRTQSRIDTFYTFYMAVDKQLIPCQTTSSLGVFDKLFKFHYVFNLSYDESLDHFYSFVQTTIFNIDVTSTEESPRVCELRAKILNDNNV